MSSRRRMKSKKNKSRSSRGGGGVREWLTGIFGSESSTQPTTKSSFWSFFSKAPDVPPGPVQIPGRPPTQQQQEQQQQQQQQQQQEQQQQQGGRRRRRTYKNKHRK